jgi:hypothetical protein
MLLLMHWLINYICRRFVINIGHSFCTIKFCLLLLIWGIHFAIYETNLSVLCSAILLMQFLYFLQGYNYIQLILKY